MFDYELTDHILRQGRALVRAIEALGTIEPTNPLSGSWLVYHYTSASAAYVASWEPRPLGSVRR